MRQARPIIGVMLTGGTPRFVGWEIVVPGAVPERLRGGLWSYGELRCGDMVVA